MGILLLGLAAVAAALVLRILLEVRLRDRHPEVRRTLVTKPYEGNLLISHMDNMRLMGFLVRRTHKTMNDPRLSLLSDAMLFLAGAFLVAIVGALLAAVGTTVLQAGAR